MIFIINFVRANSKMSGDRRAKYKPVQSLVAPERFVIFYSSDAISVIGVCNDSYDYIFYLTFGAILQFACKTTHDTLLNIFFRPLLFMFCSK